MVGMAQANRIGADVDDVKKSMVIGRYDCALLQHKTMPLCFAMWAENIIVKTIYNYHSPTILSAEDGIMRKKKGDDNIRERFQSPVPIPLQNKDYCKTFH